MNRPTRRRALPLAALAALVVFGGIYVALSDGTPALTAEALESGRQRWHAAGITSYTLALRVENARQSPQDYELTVRDGEVMKFAINGHQTKNNAAYTVRGLFDILEREIELASGAVPGGQRHPPGTKLRATFHETLGIPWVFKRIAPGNHSTFISVTAFKRS